MQTFLPYPDFEKSAKCLDYRRLGKQRVEAKQILNILLGRTDKKGWINHPAVKMWAKHINALKSYYNNILYEWISRGYNNTMVYEHIDVLSIKDPPWMTEEFCSAHRAALLYKLPEWYNQFGWIEKPEINYIWPES